jgi:transcriptional regulator with XRE-family HTH domain
MPVAEAEKNFHASGFPKQVLRNKYNLPLNERLKNARNAIEMSAKEVVTELKKQGINIGCSTLQGYESNERNLNHRYPSLTSLIALSNFYGCSMDYLFGFTDKIERPNSKTRVKSKIELKKELDMIDTVLWDGKKLSDKQLTLIKAQIDYIVGRTE